MPVKVKELKEDAIIDIQVNRHFYLMVKSLSHYLVTLMGVDDALKLKDIMNKKFEDLSELEKGFYTTALLLAEIETKANSQEMLIEKEMLLPTEEGYKKPDLPSED